MSVQDYSYLGRFAGPSIDVNLFPNAMNQGIQAGNAQQTVGQAIAGGITSGIQTGIQTIQGIQQIGLNSQQGTLNQQRIDAGAAANQVNTDPNVIAAKKQSTIAQGIIDTAKAATAAFTQGSQAQADVATNQAAAAKAQQGFSDIQASNYMNSILSNPIVGPQIIGQALNNPAMLGALSRMDPQQGQALLTQIRNRAYPQDVQNVQSILDGAITAKQRNLVADTTARENAEYLAKNRNEGITATNTLRGYSSGMARTIDDPAYNPYSLSLVDSARLTGNTDPNTGKEILKPIVEGQKATSYTWMQNGNRLPDTNPLDASQAPKYEDALRTHQTYRAALGIPKNNLQPPPAPTRQEDTGPPDQSGDVNQNILDRAKQRQAAAEKAIGSDSYQQSVIAGRTLVGKLNPTATPLNYLNTAQSTPTPATTIPLTTPVPSPTPEDPQAHVSSTLGVSKDNVSFEFPVKPINKNIFETVNNIPQLENTPAALKGLIYVESSGNPNAVSPKGAKGLTQLEPGAASEVGVSNPFNPTQAVNGGWDYLINKYNDVSKGINKAYTDVGLPPTTPDPRIVFASFNGGFKYIGMAIAAGNTDWDSIKAYITDHNLISKKAQDENFSYPEKVINASLPFIKGGNTSDDLYVASLINSGILNVHAA